MFGLFKKKSEVDKLYDQYNQQMKDAHSLSTSNRAASDAKYAEADALMKKIEELDKK
jgi:hypothetical protein